MTPDTPALRCSRERRPPHGSGIVLAVIVGAACLLGAWHLVARLAA
jgi:hypothetical protein